MKSCPNCNNYVNECDNFCQYCGYSFNSETYNYEAPTEPLLYQNQNYYEEKNEYNYMNTDHSFDWISKYLKYSMIISLALTFVYFFIPVIQFRYYGGTMNASLTFYNVFCDAVFHTKKTNFLSSIILNTPIILNCILMGALLFSKNLLTKKIEYYIGTSSILFGIITLFSFIFMFRNLLGLVDYIVVIGDYITLILGPIGMIINSKIEKRIL